MVSFAQKSGVETVTGNPEQDDTTASENFP